MLLFHLMIVLTIELNPKNYQNWHRSTIFYGIMAAILKKGPSVTINITNIDIFTSTQAQLIPWPQKFIFWPWFYLNICNRCEDMQLILYNFGSYLKKEWSHLCLWIIVFLWPHGTSLPRCSFASWSEVNSLFWLLNPTTPRANKNATMFSWQSVIVALKIFL